MTKSLVGTRPFGESCMQIVPPVIKMRTCLLCPPGPKPTLSFVWPVILEPADSCKCPLPGGDDSFLSPGPRGCCEWTKPDLLPDSKSQITNKQRNASTGENIQR